MRLFYHIILFFYILGIYWLLGIIWNFCYDFLRGLCNLVLNKEFDQDISLNFSNFHLIFDKTIDGFYFDKFTAFN